MAGPQIRQSSYRNLLLAGENKFVGRAPIKNSGTPILTIIPTTFRAQTLVLAAPAPAPTISSRNKLYQQLIKTYAAIVKLLEQNQGSGSHK